MIAVINCLFGFFTFELRFDVLNLPLVSVLAPWSSLPFASIFFADGILGNCDDLSNV